MCGPEETSQGLHTGEEPRGDSVEHIPAMGNYDVDEEPIPVMEESDEPAVTSHDADEESRNVRPKFAEYLGDTVV